MMKGLSERQEVLLRSMLGAEERTDENRWGYRNHLVIDKGSTDYREVAALELAGFVRRTQVLEHGLIVFSATREGRKAIGMTEAQYTRGQK